MERFPTADRREILDFVRKVIESRLVGLPAPPIPKIELLAASGGCFVTLHEQGELRGCIGNIGAVEPLGENLRRNAVNAAFHDPRFAPVDMHELEECDIEVSILTPMRAIASAAEFVAGRHGILLELNGRHAVFLPQVATEQGWDGATTLSYLAQKAGLAPDAWRHPQCRFQVFETEVFGEEKP